MRLRQLSSRYDVDQGFEQPQGHSLIQISSNTNPISLSNTNPISSLNNISISSYSIKSTKQYKHKKSRNKKQQAKLKFISIERQVPDSKYDRLKLQQQQKIHKSLTLDKQSQYKNKKVKKNSIHLNVNKNIQYINHIESFKQSVIPNKRSQIGQNIVLKDYTQLQVRNIKQNLLNKGAQIIFQNKKQHNSHAMFKKLMKLKNIDNFINSKYNKPLLQKITQSNINPNTISQKLQKLNKKSIQFNGDFESGNLDFVTQINPYEYDLYLKADTNTLGHQNWFYFKLFNHTQDHKNIFINICNLKRSFKLIKKGQKIYKRYRKINNILKTSIQTNYQEWSEWQKIQEDVSIVLNTDYQQNNQNDNNNKSKKVYKLSYSSTLLSQFQYQFSLLPPYTYSEMLKYIQKIQNTCKHAYVQILCFSLIGVAIPIITFTKNKQHKQKKNMILISSRIHPGQTNASYVAQGLMNKLCQQTEQIHMFLEKNIVKIIPMLNPDGVILGNFRTNYLGNDLNRCFNKDSQLLYPQICALKQLGYRLKTQYNDKFLCFLDLHGHSSQKNIFTYGPDYESTHKQYNSSRFIPKALQNLTNYFNYNKCTFKLQQSKLNTARGYFLSKLKVMAFTIQSSYSLYDNMKNINNNHQVQINLDLKCQNLQHFGSSIISCLNLWTKCFFVNTQKSLLSLSNSISVNQNHINNVDMKSMQNQLFLINKIKKQLKIQSIGIKKRQNIKTKDQQNQQNEQQQDDSDGQSQTQDIPLKQRQRLQIRFIQRNSPSLFPRILRPAIIHPQVTPPVPLFSVNKIISSSGQKNASSLNSSILNARIRRKKLNNIKPINVNNVYTEYLLKQVKGLEFLKPNVDRMIIARKQSNIITSLSQMSK